MQNLLFDLDDTILNFRVAERIALKRTLNQLGAAPTEDQLQRYHEINIMHWRLLEKKQLTREEVNVGRFRVLFDEFHLDLPAGYAAALYDTFLGIGHYFVDGAEELLRSLCQEYRLYIVTNGTASVQTRRIKSAKLCRYVENVFISETVGFDKPDPGFFRHCFARIPSFSEKETMIVGDSLTSDILGGRQANIKTVWFNPGHIQNCTGIIPHHEIDTLSALPRLLHCLP